MQIDPVNLDRKVVIFFSLCQDSVKKRCIENKIFYIALSVFTQQYPLIQIK